jgi:phospholipid/cholesterol/gamma-HCH transport system ATP-binding protein
VIDLEGVTKRFGSQEVLRGVDLHVGRGETLCLIGGSGSGKSVTLKLITRILEPDAGSILIDGQDVSHAPRHGLGVTRRKIGMLFQSGALLHGLSVFDNVALPLRESSTAMTEAEIEQTVLPILERLKVGETRDKLPGEISGGMQKRVALARAVVLKPAILLYDEPTAGLDPVRSTVVDELIAEMHADGLTQLVVTHDLATAFDVATSIAMLHEGKIVLQATPREFEATTDPIVREFLDAHPRRVVGVGPIESTVQER